MSLQPLPADLIRTLPCADTPWQVSQKVFEQQKFHPDKRDSFTQCDITSSDPEFGFVQACFQHQVPTNRMIGRIICVHNPKLTKAFEQKIEVMEEQARDPYFSPQWPQGDTPEVKQLREKTIGFWETETRPFSPFYISSVRGDGTKRKDKYENVKILPLWHGSSDRKCNSIARLGFARFGKQDFAQGGRDEKSTDIGIFGDGIYFTTSPQYAAEVYGDGHLLLSWVSMRKPFPIVADKAAIPPLEPQDIRYLKGQSSYATYNAHYTHVCPVRGDDRKTYHYPCAQGQAPIYNEYVVFDSAQTLPKFWIELAVALVKNPPLFPPDSAPPSSAPAAESLAAAAASLSLAPPPLKAPQPAAAAGPSAAHVALQPAAVKAPSICPAIAFGKSKWEQYFGDIGVEPPLPADIEAILSTPCPFFPGKTVQETHLLVLIPKTVNGRPLTLNFLGELVKQPRQGHKTQYDPDCWKKTFEVLGEAPIKNSYWVLMTKDVLPDSRSKSYADQCKLVDTYLQKTKLPYAVPHALEAATSLFLEYVQSSVHLYSTNPWIYTRCQETVDSYRVVVGGFAPAGLRVYFYSFGHVRVGVGLVRQFC